MPARILVVEDDPSIRDLLRTILLRDGYTVDTAADGDEAIAAIGNDGRFDAILLDLMMPKTDGYSVIEHVASHRRVPIVIATAAVKQIDNNRLDRSVVVRVIKKPFDVQEVSEAVGAALR